MSSKPREVKMKVGREEFQTQLSLQQALHSGPRAERFGQAPQHAPEIIRSVARRHPEPHMFHVVPYLSFSFFIRGGLGSQVTMDGQNFSACC